ncbi:MAG: ABC transporter ATP-binding protein [Myxococcales bacterium]|nr:ABC transporter ATP-binding protein [Myxococcales bacterium]
MTISRSACRSPTPTPAAEPAHAMSELLDLDEVHKHYGLYHALKGLTFRVPGGTTGLLGPNGAGKSTLLKVLLGLLPFEGSARVFGIDVRQRPRHIRAKVGYMPEKDNYLPGMNAIEYCAFAAELSGLPGSEAMSRAHAILEFCGLGDKRYQKIDGYSTGMKQRVKLAQALVHDPELLLLDEPTNGLDPAGRDEMVELIKSLPERRGCAILLSSHLLPDVEYLCERAILLHQGEVYYSGTIEALRRADTEETYDVRVKDDEEKLARALEQRGCKVERDGMLLAVRLPKDAGADLIFVAAEAEKVQVRHLQARRLTLEAAFVRVVNEATASKEASTARGGKPAQGERREQSAEEVEAGG